MRRIISPLLALLLTACQSGTVAGFSATPWPLWPGEPPADHRLGRTEVLSLHRLQGPPAWFGGLSGAVWDGDELLAITDVGGWVRFGVTADEAGRALAFGPLHGGRLAGIGNGKSEADAEEIERVADGLLVSFERHHRVLLYRHGLDQPPQPLRVPAEIARLDSNEGIETMASLSDGRVVLIAEGQDDAAQSPLWIGGADGWRQGQWLHHGTFRPTAAAPLPDGGMLVLERSFRLTSGAAMRLVRVTKAGLDQPMVTGEEWALLQAPLSVDNFEALAVRPRADGRLVATLLSDDNFNPLQSTLMLTLLLPPILP